MSIEVLRDKNEAIKKLKEKLRDNSNSYTHMQIDGILEGIADRKAFTLLLDMVETEKELSRDLFDDLIDKSCDMNHHIFLYMENNDQISTILSKMFTVKNLKSILILCVSIGVIIAVATSDTMAEKALNAIINERDK